MGMKGRVAMSSYSAAVGIFSVHTHARAAVHKLKLDGFDIRRVSVIGKHCHVNDRMKYWGQQSAFWSGVWGLMFSTGIFQVRGIGRLLVAGPLLATIIEMIERTTDHEDDAVGTGLRTIGISAESITRYEETVKTGNFVLIFQGEDEEAQKTKQVFEQTGSISTTLHVECADAHEIDDLNPNWNRQAMKNPVTLSIETHETSTQSSHGVPHSASVVIPEAFLEDLLRRADDLWTKAELAHDLHVAKIRQRPNVNRTDGEPGQDLHGKAATVHQSQQHGGARSFRITMRSSRGSDTEFFPRTGRLRRPACPGFIYQLFRRRGVRGSDDSRTDHII